MTKWRGVSISGKHIEDLRHELCYEQSKRLVGRWIFDIQFFMPNLFAKIFKIWKLSLSVHIPEILVINIHIRCQLLCLLIKIVLRRDLLKTVWNNILDDLSFIQISKEMVNPLMREMMWNLCYFALVVFFSIYRKLIYINYSYVIFKPFFITCPESNAFSPQNFVQKTFPSKIKFQ